MENASKALIIAGAILLSILIISLGLVVYNQAKDTVGSVNLSQQEIDAFNSKFTPYEGNNLPGTKVNSLLQQVIASNQAETDASTKKTILVQDKSGNKMVDKNADVTTGRVTPGKKYDVTFKYVEGIVETITIEEQP